MDRESGVVARLRRLDWAQVTIFFFLAVIVAIMAAVSYEHEFLLARGNGQSGWVSAVLPVSVDGLLAVAAVAILWAAGHGIRRPVRPYAALATGIAATIAANLFSGLHYIWLQRAVSVWSGLAVALVAETVMWFIGSRRRLAGGETDQPRADCGCPPPPVTLAELLPLARAELRARGEDHGLQALADRFGTTRYKAGKALAPTSAVPAAGHPVNPFPRVTATPPGPHASAPAAGSPPAAAGRPPRVPADAAVAAVPSQAAVGLAAGLAATAARNGDGGRRA